MQAFYGYYCLVQLPNINGICRRTPIHNDRDLLKLVLLAPGSIPDDLVFQYSPR